MTDLEPASGFSWARVKWRILQADLTELCSYCGGPLGEKIPLYLWNQAGQACGFCRACAERWWGGARGVLERREEGRP